MTLDEFRKTRSFCPDMRLAVGDIADIYFDEDDPCPGYIYEGQLIIDCDANGSNCSCTIGNDSRLGTLDELEVMLFEYANSQHIFDGGA